MSEIMLRSSRWSGSGEDETPSTRLTGVCTRAVCANCTSRRDCLEAFACAWRIAGLLGEGLEGTHRRQQLLREQRSWPRQRSRRRSRKGWSARIWSSSPVCPAHVWVSGSSFRLWKGSCVVREALLHIWHSLTLCLFRPLFFFDGVVEPTALTPQSDFPCFSRGRDPFTHVRRARFLTNVAGPLLSVSKSLSCQSSVTVIVMSVICFVASFFYKYRSNAMESPTKLVRVCHAQATVSWPQLHHSRK